MQVKINNKNYEVPELTFRHSKLMEQMGLPVEGMISKQYLFTAASAFVAIVAKCEPEQADSLIEQHILGGGNLEDIYKSYVTAISESAFFRKLLHLDEQEEKEDFKAWCKKCIARIVESDNFALGLQKKDKYALAWNESYERLNDERPCRLKQRVKTAQGEALQNGATPSKVKDINPLTIIAADKDLKPIYEKVIKEMVSYYCVYTKEKEQTQ